jgi:flavin reductase (DIM6/NTAB) family NADH-FMN oxidoreductase RutF
MHAGRAARATGDPLRTPGANVDPVSETFVTITTGLDYSMLVVTAQADAAPAGCLVGFSTQTSIDPPRYLACLSDKNRTLRVAMRAQTLGVHFLSDEQRELARLFGSETTDEIDTFSRCGWHPGPSGTPILDDCRRWFVGRILWRRKLGDHIGFLLDPIAAHAEGSAPTLLFSQVSHLDPGHAP